jgi:hypothetical protein
MADAAFGAVSGAAPVAGRAAATRACGKEHVVMALPVIGRVELPHPRDLGFYAGVGALVALQLLEWPAGVAIAIGHALAGQHQNRVITEFGEALEQA